MSSIDSKASKEEGASEPVTVKKTEKIKRRQSVALQNETMGKFLGRAAALVALLLPIGGVFGVLFTSKGYGKTVVRTLEPWYWLSRIIAAGGFGMILLLYLLDFSYWKGIFRTIRTVLVMLSGFVIVAGGILMAREYAALPMLVFLMLVPVYIQLCRKTCWKDTDNYYFLSSLSPALLVLGIMGMSTWFILNLTAVPQEVWPGGDSVVKARFYDKLLCKDTSLRCKGIFCPELIAADKLEKGDCPAFTEAMGCVVTTTANEIGEYATRLFEPVNSWEELSVYEAHMAKESALLEGIGKNLTKRRFLHHKIYVTNGTNSSADMFYNYPSLRDADVDCATAAYLLYIGLLIASVMLVIFSVVTHFIAKGMKRKSPRTQLRIFGMLTGLAILGMWMATTIAGSTPQIANLVMLFSFVGLTVIAAMAISAIGWGSIKHDMLKVPLLKSMAGAGKSDWLKAMAMFFVIPYLCFLGLSAVNQFFRVYLTPCGYNVKKKERKYCLTTIAHKQVQMIKRWPFTDIFKKVSFVGLVYYIMMVGISKFVMVFLSWLNGTLSSLALGPTVGIFYGTGLFMFLLPPVPGVPVYVLGGVVLVQSFKRAGWSFVPSLFLVTCICWAIKLNAVAMQQKLIGGMMSSSLYVRKTVAVNSLTIKAIKRILTRPGMGIDKVAILCGGPDWPTSVLTGILQLSLPKMLFGSLPVVFLVFPCVMSGAFVNNPCDCDTPPCLPTPSIPTPNCATLKEAKSLISLFTGMATVSLLLASMVQSMALFSAMYFIENCSSKHRAELMEYKNDPEVEAADEKDRQNKRVADAATTWGRVPCGQKCNLIFMFVETMLYCIAFGTVASMCFVPFEVTDKIGYSTASCLDQLGPAPPDDNSNKWNNAFNEAFGKPFAGEDYRSKFLDCEGKLKGVFYDVIIGQKNSATGANGYFIGYIMNAFVITAYIHLKIFGIWSSAAIKKVQDQLASSGDALEDICPEAFRSSTKVSPESEVDLDDEEEDTSSCRQQ